MVIGIVKIIVMISATDVSPETTSLRIIWLNRFTCAVSEASVFLTVIFVDLILFCDIYLLSCDTINISNNRADIKKSD
jgi:hypothetical protein